MLCLYVRYKQQRATEVHIEQQEKTIVLKLKIATLYNIDPCYYQLVWKETALQDEIILEDHAIQDGDTITIQGFIMFAVICHLYM